MTAETKRDQMVCRMPWPSFGFALEPIEFEHTSFSRNRRSSKVNESPQVYAWGDLTARFRTIIARQREDRTFFFRHGATKYNERNLVSGQHNTALSSRGRMQAEKLGASLPIQIDLIVCSSLRRSVETMILSVPRGRQIGVPVRVDPRLDEVHLGHLQGRRRKHLAHFEDGDLDFAPQGGESYRQAAQRVLSVIVDIFDALALSGTSPRHAVVFCHAGVLRIIATLVAGQQNPRDVFRTGFANAECLIMSARQIGLPAYWKEEHDAGHVVERHSL
jgi:Fructose-2,6-bisphosphatase